MSVSDADIELLEAHLDGELPSQEDAALRARLTSNSELSTELARLRAHREIRIEVFESFEPDDLTVKQLILGVRKQITRDALRGDRIRILRYIGSAAAVVLFSFSAGWLGKARVATQIPAQQSAQTVAQNSQAGSIDFSGSPYPVVLTDALGHVVAVQHFKTPQEAREFSQDVTSWEHQQQQMRSAVEPVVYKDQF